ncbi:hypothetical protein ABZ897_32330 [Nonomuraea sp. NPDC046802]|uniref:AMIN-like domain-containing (lipo)protein n=1 Tax=Nonomuraea sp. NPDC046802 TaxID=3154919 RepID=UPI0033F17B26
MRAAVVLAALAVLTACGTATQTVLPAATESGRPVRTGSDTPTSTSEVDVEKGGGEPALVTGVRFTAHDTYDRVVVDFDGDVPGYNVKWVDELVEDGSGEPIDVHGGAYLQITLFPADAHDERGEPTWKGGPIYPANLSNLADVVRTGDFEGRVGIGLVLHRRAAFQVKEQGPPNRLTVDVAH